MGKNRKEQAVESTLLANYEKYYRLRLVIRGMRQMPVISYRKRLIRLF